MATIAVRNNAKGEKIFRACVRVQGYRSRSAQFKRKNDAKQWAQQVEADIHSGHYVYHQEAHQHTLSEAIDRYTNSVLPELNATLLTG